MGEASDKMPVAKARSNLLGRLFGMASGLTIGIVFMTVPGHWTTRFLFALGVGLTIYVGASMVLSILWARRWRRGLADINNGIAALARGQQALANETFTRWCDSRNRVVSAWARHSLGWTLMRQGRLEEAAAVVTDNDAAHDRELQRLSLHATSSVDLALYSALLGKLEVAESWLEITEQRAHGAVLPSFAAMRVFARAVLDCRKDRCEDAVRSLDERWAECELSLTGEELRPLRIVRAYAHAAAGPRNAGIADTLLTSSRPLYDGEYDFLGVAWPAMQTFLESHRLTRERAA